MYFRNYDMKSFLHVPTLLILKTKSDARFVYGVTYLNKINEKTMWCDPNTNMKVPISSKNTLVSSTASLAQEWTFYYIDQESEARDIF